jgi:hypothetical protein
LEGSCIGLIEIPSQHLPVVIEKTTKTSVSIAGNLAEIRTEHLPNANLERYCQTNLFGELRKTSKKLRIVVDPTEIKT